MRLQVNEANSEAARALKEFENKEAKMASSHNKELGALREQASPQIFLLFKELYIASPFQRLNLFIPEPLGPANTFYVFYSVKTTL
jgi:hypothetical protein